MKLTPVQSARLWGLRHFGQTFWTIMPEASKRQLQSAYIAGLRRGKRQRNGKS